MMEQAAGRLFFSAEVWVPSAAEDHPSFSEEPVPFYLQLKPSNPESLEAAVTAAAAFLDKAVKPVLVGGVKLRQGKAQVPDL